MFVFPASTDRCFLQSRASYLRTPVSYDKNVYAILFYNWFFYNFTCKRKENVSVCKFLKILNQLLPELWWCSSRKSNIIDYLTIVQIRRRIVTKRNLGHWLLLDRKLKYMFKTMLTSSLWRVHVTRIMSHRVTYHMTYGLGLAKVTSPRDPSCDDLFWPKWVGYISYILLCGTVKVMPREVLSLLKAQINMHL